MDMDMDPNEPLPSSDLSLPPPNSDPKAHRETDHPSSSFSRHLLLQRSSYAPLPSVNRRLLRSPRAAIDACVAKATRMSTRASAPPIPSCACVSHRTIDNSVGSREGLVWTTHLCVLLSLLLRKRRWLRPSLPPPEACVAVRCPAVRVYVCVRTNVQRVSTRWHSNHIERRREAVGRQHTHPRHSLLLLRLGCTSSSASVVV